MSRLAIPPDMKRQVRQRCGFGCVICGIPFFHYDHIVEFSEVHEHTADNITLLCGTHHDQKTRGLLPRAIVERANASPVNQNSTSTPSHRLMTSVGEAANFVIGSNRCCTSEHTHYSPTIAINGLIVLGCAYEDGYILFDTDLYDSNGNRVLSLRRGEITVSTRVMDYEQVGPNIIVRDHFCNEPILDVTFAPDGLTLSRGLFMGPNGFIHVLPDLLNMNGLIVKKSESLGAGRCAFNLDQRQLIFRSYNFVGHSMLLDGRQFESCTFVGCHILQALEAPARLNACYFSDCTRLNLNSPPTIFYPRSQMHASRKA